MRYPIKINAIAIAIWLGLCSGNTYALSPGPIDANFFQTPLGFSANFGNDAVTSSTFTDHYTFTATPPMFGAGAIGVLSGFDLFGFDVHFDSLELWDLTTSTLVAPGFINAGQFVGFTGFLGLSSGHDYDIIVTGGLNAGQTSGTYAGNVLISPVPEPEKYAMLLVGLGLVGIAARRRRNSLH